MSARITARKITARVSLRNQSFDKSRFQDLLAIRLAAGTSKMLHLQHCKFCVDRFFFFIPLAPISLSLFCATAYRPHTLAAVFNPCSLSANHSERRASIHPGINSRDSPPLLPLPLFLSRSPFPAFFILAVAQWRVDRPALVDHSGLMDARGARFFLVLFVGIAHRVEYKKNRSPWNRKGRRAENLADEQITYC